MGKGPGHWQRGILTVLEERPCFQLVQFVFEDLGRPLTYAEYTALHRAAKQLERAGRCVTFCARSKSGRYEVFVCRPDLAIDDKPVSVLKVESVTNETGSTFRQSSYRHIAKVLGVSHTTVWRSCRGMHGIDGERCPQRHVSGVS